LLYYVLEKKLRQRKFRICRRSISTQNNRNPN